MNAAADRTAPPQGYAALLAPSDEAPAADGWWGRARRLAGAMVDLVYPPHCMGCGAPLEAGGNATLCVSCIEDLEWIGADRCTHCGDRAPERAGAVLHCDSCGGNPRTFPAQVAAVARYGPVARALVLGLKFGRQYQAAPFMAALMAHRVADVQLAEDPGEAVLAPVPLFAGDARGRGFNQAALLAELMGARLGWPVASDLIRKTRPTRPQAVLARTERLENLREAFAIRPEAAARWKGRTLVLIDDVVTTGATLEDVTRALRAAGWAPDAIRAAAFARSSAVPRMAETSAAPV